MVCTVIEKKREKKGKGINVKRENSLRGEKKR
jgi:hypothetical protein